MKRSSLIIVIILAAAFAAPAFAGTFDFGGALTNTSSFGNSADETQTPGDAAGFLQKDLLNLWLQYAFNENLMFTAQFGAALTYGQLLSTPLVAYLDFDVLALQGTFHSPDKALSLFRYSLGRAVIADFTTLVLSQKADGFSFGFDFPAVSVNLAFGYTGLVVKGSSSIALSRADVNDVANSSVWFASPRLLQLVEVSMPSFLGQKLTISTIFQEDLRGSVFDLTGKKSPLVESGSTTQDTVNGGTVNSQYLGLGLSGSIVNSLYYDLYSYLETGSMLAFSGGSYESILFAGVLAGGGLRYYLPNLLFSVISAKLLYASGDPSSTTVVEGDSKGFSIFEPITRPSHAEVFSPQLSNLVVIEASYSLKPLSWLGTDLGNSIQAVAAADVYFRPTSGAISEPGIEPGSTDLYLGTEVDLTVNYRPLSDLGLSVSGGVFLPGAAFGSSPPLQWKVGLNLSLSF